jgi:hypothetical protein
MNVGASPQADGRTWNSADNPTRDAHLAAPGVRCLRLSCPSRLINDEQLRSRRCGRAVWLRVIRDLIAHPWTEVEGASIRQPGLELAFKHEQDMPFVTPVVCHIPRGVFHRAHAQVAKELRSPDRDAALAGMGGGFNGIPVRDAEGKVGDLHGGALFRVGGSVWRLRPRYLSYLR